MPSLVEIVKAAKDSKAEIAKILQLVLPGIESPGADDDGRMRDDPT